MSREDSFLTADLRDVFKHTIIVRQPLQEQFRDFAHQTDTARLGMWLFLATEVMFFGALFVAFGVYRYLYPAAFELASSRLNWQIGTINTLVLLASSFTMVLAVHYARLGNARKIANCLLLTGALGTLFLVLKGYEYYIDYRENLIPGWRFDPLEWTAAANDNADLRPGNVELFLILYWVMTLIHAVHLTIGIALMLLLAGMALRGRFSTEYYTPVDVAGLYWHFVDVVWIFLLPLLYLQATHQI
ncbi:MAG: cytochrome c oxidase subunit 3 [Pirellulales bacterium]